MTVDRNTSLRYPGGKKALFGACAYVLGYLITVPFATVYSTRAMRATAISTYNDSTTLAEILKGVSVPLWKRAGWMFYNAHFVPISVPRHSMGLTSVSVNTVRATGGPLLILFLVPILLCMLAGGLAVRKRRTTVTGQVIIGGGYITLGYLPLAIIVSFLLSVGVNEGTLIPDRMATVFLPGLVYPALFGALGALLTRRLFGTTEPVRTFSGEPDGPASK